MEGGSAAVLGGSEVGRGGAAATVEEQVLLDLPPDELTQRFKVAAARVSELKKSGATKVSCLI
jgi:hypothetical protein